MKILWLLFGGRCKKWGGGAVISMYFRVFSKGQGKWGLLFLGMFAIPDIFGVRART